MTCPVCGTSAPMICAPCAGRAAGERHAALVNELDRLLRRAQALEELLARERADRERLEQAHAHESAALLARIDRLNEEREALAQLWAEASGDVDRMAATYAVGKKGAA